MKGERLPFGEKPIHNQHVKKVILEVGNTEGIATVDDQMTVVIPEPEAQFHLIVKGKYLSKITKNYYGNPMKYPMLSDPDKIYLGQVLRISTKKNKQMD